jgi:hypothetical protein
MEMYKLFFILAEMVYISMLRDGNRNADSSWKIILFLFIIMILAML